VLRSGLPAQCATPFFFQKPTDAIQNVPIGTVADHPYPSLTSGTPENVGPVVRGDVLLCKLEGLPDMSIRIV
jgi:hypothetical protein